MSKSTKPSPTKPKSRWRRLFLAGLALFGALVLGLGGLVFSLSTPMPVVAIEHANGSAAERLAERISVAVDAAAWERTRALRWQREFARPVLWDRDREFVEVKTDDETRVLLDLRADRAVAFRAGEPLSGDALDEAKARARFWFTNEAFWLMAPLKHHDAGTERYAVEHEGREALLVRYRSGGVTPGDSYLWELDDAGRPTAWRIWTEIVPIPGLRFTWTDWRTLSTGAVVAWRRESAILSFGFEYLDAADSLEALDLGPDPFAPLTR